MKGRIFIAWATLGVFFSLSFSRAADIVWTNTSGGNWSDSSNWTPNQVPEVPDVAIITNSGNYSVTLDADAAVGGVILGAGDSTTQTFTMDSHVLSFTGLLTVNTGAQFDLNGNTLDGGSDTAVIAGVVNVAGGQFTGTFTLATNGTINLKGTYGSPVFYGTTLTNLGTINWDGTPLYGYNSAHIVNHGLWNARTNASFHGDSSQPTLFDNDGTFRKSVATGFGTVLDAYTVFNNTGTVDVQAGTVEFDAGTGSGTFNTESNAFTSFFSYILAGNVIFSGNGYVGGSVFSDQATLFGSLNIAFGEWDGSLTIASNATVNLEGIYGSPSFSGTVATNYGTVNWDGTDLYGYTNPHFVNYGLWNARTNATLHGGNATVFDNYGTFRKSAGPGYGTVVDAYTIFNNLGTVEVLAGTLEVRGGTGRGTFNVASNAFFGMYSYTLTGDPIFTGAGMVGGSVFNNKATLHGALTFAFGELDGSLTVASNATLDLLGIYGSPSFSGTLFTNYGIVDWDGTDLYGYSSPHFVNYGLWDARTNATLYGGSAIFDNYGTFRKSSGPGYGTVLDAYTAFNNIGIADVQAGTLEIRNGTGTGTFNTTSNAFTGLYSYTLAGDPTFTGTGYIGGNCQGNNAVLHGLVNVAFGSFSGSLTFASDATVNLEGIYGSPSFSGIQLTNNGTVNWDGTDLYAYSSPHFVNHGLWNARTNATFRGDSGGPATFKNSGTVLKSGGLNYGTVFNTYVMFDNSGTVDVQSGTLELDAGTGTGTFNTASNAFTGLYSYTLAGDSTFTGTGYIGGNCQGNNAVLHGLLNVAFGSFSGSMTFASDATVNLEGIYGSPSFSGIQLTNNGTVNWDGTDLYAYSSPHFVNHGLWNARTNATFHGDSGGPAVFDNYNVFQKSAGPNYGTVLNSYVTFKNAGTIDVQTGILEMDGSQDLTGGTLHFGINSLNNYGSLFLGGTPALIGTLSVSLNNGYSPVESNAFTVIDYPSETGTFTTVTLPHLPPPLVWDHDYGSSAFTLSVTSAPPVQLSSIVAQTGTNISLNWDAIPGLTYQVQTTTNLAPANWVNFGNPITGSNGPVNISDLVGQRPQKFYRIVLLP